MFLKCLDASVLNAKEKLKNKLIALYLGRILAVGHERSTIFITQLKGRIEMLLVGSADCHVH